MSSRDDTVPTLPRPGEGPIEQRLGTLRQRRSQLSREFTDNLLTGAATPADRVRQEQLLGEFQELLLEMGALTARAAPDHHAEAARESAERRRVLAEHGRAAAEAGRARVADATTSAEEQRQINEELREGGESMRRDAEQARSAAEEARAAAEDAREAAREARAVMEELRRRCEP